MKHHNRNPSPGAVTKKPTGPIAQVVDWHLKSDTGYQHDGRADKDSYPQDGRADKEILSAQPLCR